MAQQPQATSQFVFGPVNGGGDVLHVINNANGTAGWVDKNNFAQGVSSVVNALQGGAPATLTGTTGGTFSTVPLSAPGASALEQIPFTVKAAGWVSFGAGTYTATVQPLIYASTSAGFTSSAAAAVLSAAAINVTVAAATAASVFPWEGEVTVCGDSTSGKLVATVTQRINNGAQQLTTPAVGVNVPSSVNFANAVPLQFLAGVTLSNATTPIVNLGSFFLES